MGEGGLESQKTLPFTTFFLRLHLRKELCNRLRKMVRIAVQRLPLTSDSDCSIDG